MDATTTIHCPDLIRGGRSPWTGTVKELVGYSSPERIGMVAADLGFTGDDWTDADVIAAMTLASVRDLADDPNAEIVAHPLSMASGGLRRGHDWVNYRTCRCGEPGCGSYRPFPDLPSVQAWNRGCPIVRRTDVGAVESQHS